MVNWILKHEPKSTLFGTLYWAAILIAGIVSFGCGIGLLVGGIIWVDVMDEYYTSFAILYLPMVIYYFLLVIVAGYIVFKMER